MARFNFIYLLAILYYARADRKYVDLTYTLDEKIVRWPSHEPFKLIAALRGKFGNVPWVASNNIETAEHMGTHMDAPYHFYEQGWTIDNIPFSKLHGSGVVIDIKKKAAADRDAEVSVHDLLDWEKKNGRIPDGAYVLMNSGWSQYWGDTLRSIGTKNDTSNLHYPGFSNSSAQWLAANRPKIAAFGSDTISCDHGPSTEFPAHQVLQGLNIMCIENVGGLDNIPAAGAEIFAMPMKIGNGTGAPLRMFALIDDVKEKKCTEVSYASHLMGSLHFITLILLSVVAAFNFLFA